MEPATAQQMADALKMHETKGDYDAISDGDAFAARLTTDLQDVSHDKHLRVDFNPFKMPPRDRAYPGRRGAISPTDGTRQLRVRQG